MLDYSKMLISASILSLTLFSVGCATFSKADKLTEAEKEGIEHFKSAIEKVYARDAKAALKEFDEGLNLYPENTDAILNKGGIYFDLADYDAAISEFEHVLDIDSEHYQAMRSIWGSRIEREDNSDSEKKLVEKDIVTFKEENADNVDAIYQAYRALQYIDKDTDALVMIPGLLKMDKGNLNVLRLSSDLYYDAIGRKDDEKEKIFLAYLDLFPVSLKRRSSVYSGLLTLYREKEDGAGIDDMVAIGHRWLKEDQNNRWANHIVARNFIKANIRLGEAEKYLHRAIRLIAHPDINLKPEFMSVELWHERLKISEGDYYNLLGYSNYLKGNNKSASFFFNKSLKIFNESVDLYKHMGQLYEKEGRLNDAYDAYLNSALLGEDKDDPEDVADSLKRLALLIYKDFKEEDVVSELHAKEKNITFFKDITKAAGLSDIKGNRVAWGDYNNDGYEDLLINGTTLLENKDGQFLNVSKQVGISDNQSTGGLWADFNNDGFLDFYMMGRLGQGHKFMKNIDGKKFEDISSEYMTDKYYNEAAAWGDLDNDGLIDLYVANYEKSYAKSTGIGVCRPDYFWHNNGDGFDDFSMKMGVQGYYKYRLCGRGVSMADYDNDGSLEVLVSNYRLDPNNLWKLKNGKLVDVAEELNVKGFVNNGAYGHTIGSVWGDYDNDGDLDLFMANLAHPHLLGLSDKSIFLRNDNGKLVDITETTGIKYNETDSDPTFVDFDNDGDLDLYITSIYDGRVSHLYMNENGFFTDVTWLAGVRVDNGWGNGFADFDNDGDLDLLVASYDGIRLFENQGNANHWLGVDLTNAKGSGIGARIKVIAKKLVQIREVEGGKGTASQNSLSVEFGLGTYDGIVDVEISFLTGEKLNLKGVRLDQKLHVDENGIL